LPSSDISRWRSEYPLAIGKEAVKRAALYLPEVYEAIPFRSDEKALWALRIERGRDELDLYGLAEYGPNGLHVGELKFCLRGHGVGLVDIVKQARQWWAKFRGLPVGGGRPLNSGAWRGRDDFAHATRKAIADLRGKGTKPTQEKVATVLSCSDGQLRRWIRRYGLSWDELLKTP
jgi:hypothetical protein